MVNSRFGTKITVRQKCLSCSFTTSWDSQPPVGDIPVGNIMMSSSILFGGGSPAKVLNILKHMNVPTIAYSTFMQHQKKYLHPAVQRTYKEQQRTLLTNIEAEGRELILGGDGRCDSPGHSAKYGTYSLMDVEQDKILDSQLVQVCTYWIVLFQKMSISTHERFYGLNALTPPEIPVFPLKFWISRPPPPWNFQ